MIKMTIYRRELYPWNKHGSVHSETLGTRTWAAILNVTPTRSRRNQRTCQTRIVVWWCLCCVLRYRVLVFTLLILLQVLLVLLVMLCMLIVALTDLESWAYTCLSLVTPTEDKCSPSLAMSRGSKKVVQVGCTAHPQAADSFLRSELTSVALLLSRVGTGLFEYSSACRGKITENTILTEGWAVRVIWIRDSK